jgi:hydrogenase maturation protease
VTGARPEPAGSVAPLDVTCPGEPGPAEGAPDVLLVGYGNALRSDDGVGWHVARRAASDPRFAGARVVALHQLVPELALDLSGARLAIFVDADAAAGPGTVTVGPVEQSAGRSATSHHVDAGSLLLMARHLYGAAPMAAAVGVGIATMDVGEQLSPEVEAALPRVLEAILEAIGAGTG